MRTIALGGVGAMVARVSPKDKVEGSSREYDKIAI